MSKKLRTKFYVKKCTSECYKINCMSCWRNFRPDSGTKRKYNNMIVLGGLISGAIKDMDLNKLVAKNDKHIVC